MPLFQAVRGMNDCVPAETPYWRHVETVCRSVAEAYACQEIRFPVVESTALFKRCIGDVTDIVEKEMYTFLDRNGDSLSLRPEGTAGCVRALLEQGLLHHQSPKVWYIGPMFRHERPQKGRLRQFHQFGVEWLGEPGPDVDAELIALSYRLLKQVGLQDCVALQLNSLGTKSARAAHRAALIAYLEAHQAQLDEEAIRRLHTNPLRILDSKNPAMQAVIGGAPRLDEYWDQESRAHFDGLCRLLDAESIPYTLNPNLVRGLDYYQLTVFEWVTTALGAQGTVCAGGRYDGLVEALGGKPTPAVGLAAGLERLVLLLQAQEQRVGVPDIYVIAAGLGAALWGFEVAERVRDALPHLKVERHPGEASFKSQMKRADKSGARWALIMGETEVAAHAIALKDLREEGTQVTYSLPQLIEKLRSGFR